MKIIIALYLILPILCFGQNNYPKDNPKRLILRRNTLETDVIAPSNIKLPFSNIKIIDSRFDTSKIGFTFTAKFFHNRKKAFDALTYKGGIQTAIQDYYNTYYEKAFEKNQFELVIVLKKFWHSLLPLKKIKSGDVSKLDFEETSFHVKVEYYLHKNQQYLPLKRVDTVLAINTNSLIKMNDFSDDYTSDVVTKTILKLLIENYDFSPGVYAFDKTVKKNWTEIETYNKSRFAINILKDSTIKEGAYKSFGEFKNNSPSLLNIKEKRMRLKLFKNTEYIVDNNDNPLENYWGYFIEEKLVYNKYLDCKMYKVENSFFFFIKSIWYTTDNSTPSFNIRQKNELWIPVQLDMETGNIY